jgi:putative hemin transport protein
MTVTLKEKWAALTTENPKLRIRDAANTLGVSEMELLATKCGLSVTRLAGEPREIFKEVPKLGYVMALTRNEACVHERKGEFGEVQIQPHGNMGLVVGDDIDLRVFFSSWKYVFAEENGNRGSLQFFDKYGSPVHKVHLTEKSNFDEFRKIISKYKSPNQFISETIETFYSSPQLENSSLDQKDFLREWSELKDTHQFFGLLKKFNVSRVRALEFAEGLFSKKLSIESVEFLLRNASEKNIPIMVFVGNPGMIQIHTGYVKNIQMMGDWVNVMDQEFNLHLRKDLISSIWHVIKPTDDGDVNSIEVYDAANELIVQFFGKRKPGNPELEEWRNVLALLS